MMGRMMGLFDSPKDREFLGKATPVVRTAEQIAKEAADAERKQKAEHIMNYNEMYDNLTKMLVGLSDARAKAILATPRLGGLLGVGKLDGLSGNLAVAKGDPDKLDVAQKQMREFLLANEPHYKELSDEKKALIERCKEVENYLSIVSRKYEQTRRDNDHLVKTVRVLVADDFEMPYDYDSGADPAYEAAHRSKRSEEDRLATLATLNVPAYTPRPTTVTPGRQTVSPLVQGLRNKVGKEGL